jgi:nucleoside-diphosphate-sugar epimerase
MPEFQGRLIVLGATGFVGSHVVKRAKEADWEVVSLSSREVDLSSDAAVASLAGVFKDGDTVIHGAAVVPTRNAMDIVRNLLMTQHLVDSLASHEIAQVVVVSSDAVYGSESNVTNEASPCAPDSLHGVMSLAREMICSEVQSPIVTFVRPTAIYGIGDTHNSYGPNRFVRQALDGGVVTVFGAGEAVRDHVAIDDVAEVIFQAVAGRQAGIINIACGASVSFGFLAKLVQQAGPEGTLVKITGSESSPTFRSYDISGLTRRFPGVRMRGVEEGLGDMLGSLA